MNETAAKNKSSGSVGVTDYKDTKTGSDWPCLFLCVSTSDHCIPIFPKAWHFEVISSTNLADLPHLRLHMNEVSSIKSAMTLNALKASKKSLPLKRTVRLSTLSTPGMRKTRSTDEAVVKRT